MTAISGVRGDWYGTVEDTNDPLKLGRVRVRIRGIHTDNTVLLPTADLPWASIQQPPNVYGSFSVPLEGTDVVGYFSDGKKSQMPIITGTIPRIFGVPLLASLLTSNTAIAKDRLNGIPVFGTLGTTSVSYAALGDVANTVIANTNMNIEHACDFRYFINLPKLDIGLSELINPITEIQNSIRAGKNRAQQIMSLLLTQINTQLRLVFNALIPALGLDPSGELSKSWSVAKSVIHKINKITKDIARVAEVASLYYNLVKDITQIVDYLKSLPARILAMVKGCIDQFLNSIQNFINQIKSIPGMFGSDIDNLLNQLSMSTQSASNAANTASITTSNTQISDIINITIYNTDTEHANLISNFISTNYANANVTMANATANSYNKASTQSP